jgi:lysophospholipase L1-like esterase
MMKNSGLLWITGALLITGGLRAQLVEEFNAPPANCCLAGTAKTLADQLQDWNQLGRYRLANQELKKKPADSGRVVFMGDSITDGWRLDEYFPGKPYVNRGISGQTTPQMLVRMYPDVIDLKPAAMVVLAGTNDIARNTGPSTPEMIQHNIMAMTELAQQHGIKVLLCSILPVSDYPYLEQQRNGVPAPRTGLSEPVVRRRMTVGRPPEDILKLNAWLKEYARRVNATYVDYFPALADEKGWLKEGLANDGLHPNADGYKIMAPIVSAAIQGALR